MYGNSQTPAPPPSLSAPLHSSGLSNQRRSRERKRKREDERHVDMIQLEWDYLYMYIVRSFPGNEIPY